MRTHDRVATDALVGARESTSAQVSLFAVAAAVGGRGLWRLWIPLVAYVGAGLLSYVNFWMSGTQVGASTQFPATVLILSTPGWVGLLWLWGARFALSMGYQRTQVFSLVWALSIIGPLTLPVVAIGVQFVEKRVGFLGGWSVWSVEDTEFGPRLSEMLMQSYVVNYFPMLASPVLLALRFGAIAWLRSGAARALGVFACALIVMLALFVAVSAIDFSYQPSNQMIVLLMPVIVGSTAGGYVAWRMFRGIPA